MPSKKPNPIDQHVGSRIRMRRLMMKMNQTELSRRLGLTWQSVQKYEKGDIRIGASRLEQISRILQVTPAFFFEGAPRPVQTRSEGKEAPPPDYVTEFLATRDGLALAKAFARVRDIKLRRRIVRLVAEILRKT
jgi:transcriptional regulator with XRE-family HTH domain